MTTPSSSNAQSPARRLAFDALKEIYRGGYADVVLHRLLAKVKLSAVDRAFATELVYGTVRRQRTLDALIDQLGKKPAHQQLPELRVILHLGFYQLRFLTQVPESAAVNTSVELTKALGKGKLSGVVNGILRQYIRRRQTGVDPLTLPSDRVTALGIQHSFPDWMVELWLEQLGETDAIALCDWFNQPPAIDLRVNVLQQSREAVQQSLAAAGITVTALPHLSQALRLPPSAGAIQALPGYAEGHWTVQDASAQLVSTLVAPQPGNLVVDACAAPGGKTTHLAELMGDQGLIWACDRTPSRLKKISQNVRRLQLNCIQTCQGDSTEITKFEGEGDRVLVDAPCSGLGTLHRHADARWRQTPASVQELAALQLRLLNRAATWVKPTGTLVYATCTLHPMENEAVIEQFLSTHPDWQILPPQTGEPTAAFATPEGWVKVWPHQANMDGFFMVRLGRRM
ncbi:16S rRNA (cytosine(967)-C(5))-methyltransferase [Leptolyngbya iicbica]|uniref:16S rRNA (cytosine(967)-C(5))-methyltransferase n=2 Tax=Cyanophyceae TaxID=3028117 RepID=A0A4Q7E8M0_9CYAN|nr:16S rRNA (cytosine(967)-C(5))-methyltransferase [Leptolyngbya sp. LK]RZM77181.1 16S rRNA (cytosine(967)-C(5))-methyltransferase [Leptolyngbya sp. LK]